MCVPLRRTDVIHFLGLCKYDSFIGGLSYGNEDIILVALGEIAEPEFPDGALAE